MLQPGRESPAVWLLLPGTVLRLRILRRSRGLLLLLLQP